MDKTSKLDDNYDEEGQPKAITNSQRDGSEPAPFVPDPYNPNPGQPQPTPTYADTYTPEINGLYNQYYGRDASADEVNAHRGNPGGFAAIETMLRDSMPVAEKGVSAPVGAAATTNRVNVGGGGAPQPMQARSSMGAGPDYSGIFGGQAAEAAAARAAQQKKADELYDFLMGKAHQSEKIDPNDPIIRAQSDTYSANLTREGRRYMSELAERKGPGGNIGAESRMMAEHNAQAGASHEGQLFQHELDSRRAEIQNALTQGAQFLTSQQQMSLQKELATIETNMKMFQTQLQESQFSRNLEQQGSLAREQMGQSAGQFGSSMSQRENEFARNLSQRAYEYDTEDQFRRR